MSARAAGFLLFVCTAVVLPQGSVFGQSNSSAAPGSAAALLTSARTVCIQITQSYVNGEEQLKGITVPAAATAARIFGCAGLKSVSAVGRDTLAISISIAGEGESADYMPGGTLATGASIKGTITLGSGESAVQIEFQGEEPPPQVVTLGAENLLPFDAAFDQSTFPSVLLELVGEAFGSTPVVKALADPAAPVRRAAVVEAAAMNDAQGATAIVAMLKDKDVTVRTASAEALGKLRLGSAFQPLVTALKSQTNAGWPEMRTATVRSLGAIADARATPTLVTALTDPDADVRKAAAEGLASMGWQAVTDQERISVAVAQADFAAAAAFGKAAVPRLGAAARDANPAVRDSAISALADMDDPAGLSAVIALARDKGQSDFTARTLAVAALGRSKDPRAAEALRTLLKDTDYTIFSQAADALADNGDHEIVPSLLAVLKSKDDMLREAAASALGKLGWKPANDQEALVFYPAIRDWDACVSLGDKAVPTLVETVQSSGFWFDAIDAIGRIGTRSAVSALIKLLRDDNPAFRAQAATALGKTRSAAARDSLKRALKDEAQIVRDAAQQALEDLKGGGAPP